MKINRIKNSIYVIKKFFCREISLKKFNNKKYLTLINVLNENFYKLKFSVLQKTEKSKKIFESKVTIDEN